MEIQHSDSKILLIYFMGQVSTFVLFILAKIIFSGIQTDLELYLSVNAIVLILMYLGLFIVYLSLYKRYFIEQARDFVSKLPFSYLLVIGTFFVMLFASFIAKDIMHSFGLHETSDNQASLEALSSGPLYMKIILISVVLFFAPIIEEFAFRKGIFGVFKNYHVAVPILLSGIVFGFIHVLGDNLLQIIPYATMGIVLSVMYVISKRNIYVVIFGHMTYNLLSLWIMLS